MNKNVIILMLIPITLFLLVIACKLYCTISSSKAETNLSRNESIELPFYLDFNTQQESNSAQKVFYNYVLKINKEQKRKIKNFKQNDVIAYKIDLNNDGIEEVVGLVRHPDFLIRCGTLGHILMPSQAYKKSVLPKSINLQRDIDGFSNIGNFCGYYDGLQVLSSKTKSFNDLKIYRTQESLEKERKAWDFEYDRFDVSKEFREEYKENPILKFNNQDYKYD